MHQKILHVVFTGSFKWMNYMYTKWLGSKIFQKPRGDLKNLGFSDTKRSKPQLQA